MDTNKLKTIAVAGATGLIGSALVEILIKDVTVNKIIILSRRELFYQSHKVQVVITDFSKSDSFPFQREKVDILFCCIGTTLKTAGSKSAFRKVDYDIPLLLAEWAQKTGIRKFIAVSSLGADPDSSNFYLKTKGEMEQDIDTNCRFQKLAFVRPSMLLGPRNEFRLGERIAQFLMVIFSFAMIGRFSRFKPIEHSVVAKAMLSISNSLNNQKIYESSELHWLGR